MFTDVEVAVIQWAEAVASNTARRDPDAFDALQEHFSETQIVELTVVIAVRTMVNLIQEALWTDLEGPDFPKNTRHAVSDDPSDWYAWYVDEVLGSMTQRGSVRADEIGPDG